MEGKGGIEIFQSYWLPITYHWPSKREDKLRKHNNIMDCKRRGFHREKIDKLLAEQ